ncbi:unnamed protein product, partial [marine sediment metagenome]
YRSNLGLFKVANLRDRIAIPSLEKSEGANGGHLLGDRHNEKVVAVQPRPTVALNIESKSA